ncbi:MAG: hypothetical protein OXT07_13935 [bacterium]|nr:hypothetical protein [bacterium]MDE0217353.1 hypothetical protein [bacterium]
MTKPRLLAVMAALFLLVAACGSSGAPTSYTDNPADFEIPELGILEENVGQAERNYRTGCWEAGKEQPERLDERLREEANLAAVCKCGFDRIRDELTFDEFKELDDDLRSNINTGFPEEVDLILRQCIRDLSGV